MLKLFGVFALKKIWFEVFLIRHLPFLLGSSPFDSLDQGLTPVRVTASYWNEGLVAATV